MRYHGKTVKDAISKAVRGAGSKELTANDCDRIERLMDDIDLQISDLNRQADEYRAVVNSQQFRQLLSLGVIAWNVGAVLLPLGAVVKAVKAARKIRQIYAAGDALDSMNNLYTIVGAITGARALIEELPEIAEAEDIIRRFDRARSLLRRAANDLEAEVRRLHDFYRDSDCRRIAREGPSIG